MWLERHLVLEETKASQPPPAPPGPRPLPVPPVLRGQRAQLQAPQEWLSRFGYLPPADPSMGRLRTPEELSQAIAAMQRFGGLEATGVLDEGTLALMRTPRCSLPDLPAVAPARRRRQALAPTKWNKRNLSWRVRSFPRGSPLGRDTVRALMYYALKVWSDVAPLDFHEVAGSAADIQVAFSRGAHNDRYPFDGPGGALAHAFLPGDRLSAGDTHFDDDEAWTFRSAGRWATLAGCPATPAPSAPGPGGHQGLQRSLLGVEEGAHSRECRASRPRDPSSPRRPQGPGGARSYPAVAPSDEGAADPNSPALPHCGLWPTAPAHTPLCLDASGLDLFTVAVHEFGHALGLSHVAAPGSIMQPYYRGPAGDPLRYGLSYEDRVRVWQLYGVRESVSPTAQPNTPEPEEPPLLPEPPDNRSRTPPREDAPHRCDTHFDAVAQIRGEAFFFKGMYFWRLTRDRHLVSLQPAQVHRFWRGLPLQLDSVDAVYERAGDHKIVFFKGDRYWVFKDNHVEEGHPRPISDFGLPPGGIDAAFSWVHSDKTYFFKDQLYWRYDERTRHMDPGHPARSPPWRGVPSTLDDAMRWSDGASYFFRGKEYWKLLDGELEAAPGYPQPAARDWLVCTDLQATPQDSAAPGEAGARAQPGQKGQSRSEDAYEVCSCTSGGPPPHLLDVLLLLLPPGLLWTAAGAPVP
ncbi:Matrix metalloproteinase-17 [Galemys pyrenaicus]|uniref:Matrix metalloproteinase-17 n=1 Tax=Galemys pyrenaicus TaxID=202257 RepID=A0A8J6ANN0_GALPY|nr:Matrix metalloproteinase-17 [Galemys pyrenaicus]